jgi:hypothetical protein
MEPLGRATFVQEQDMSKRKLSRLIGLVFVLVASIGGTSAYAFGAEHGTGASSTVTDDGSGTPTETVQPQPTETPSAETYDWQWT